MTKFLSAHQMKNGWYANITTTYKFENKTELMKFIHKEGYIIYESISDLNTIKAHNFCPDSIAKKESAKRSSRV